MSLQSSRDLSSAISPAPQTIIDVSATTTPSVTTVRSAKAFGVLDASAFCSGLIADDEYRKDHRLEHNLSHGRRRKHNERYDEPGHNAHDFGGAPVVS